MKNSNDNIVNYPKKRKKIPLNAAVIFFAVILIYLIIMIIRSFTQESLSVYEVREGEIVEKSDYTGIILRDETVYYTAEEGYISYYNRNNSKIAVGNLVYTIDKDGKFNNTLVNLAEQGDISLDAENLKLLKRKISGYMMDFSADEFDEVYDIKLNIMNELHFYTEKQLSVNSSLSADADGIYSAYYSDVSGVISYCVDGYEELTADEIRAEDFTESKYVKSSLTDGEKKSLWDPVYKIIKTDEWSIVIKPDKKDLELLSGLEYVAVNFKYNDITADAEVSLVTGSDNELYAELKFDRYMTEFITDRFVDFEICYQETDGLKIPKTSVVTKEVLKIPVQYGTYGGNGQTLGFMKDTGAEDGSAVQFVTGTIYKEDDFYYYVDCADLKVGDILVKEGANADRYELCMTEVLDGVYSVNKGYAVFKRIYILGEKENYYIVQKGIRKGISVFDHIALNGNEIAEDEIIY